MTNLGNRSLLRSPRPSGRKSKRLLESPLNLLPFFYISIYIYLRADELLTIGDSPIPRSGNLHQLVRRFAGYVSAGDIKYMEPIPNKLLTYGELQYLYFNGFITEIDNKFVAVEVENFE